MPLRKQKHSVIFAKGIQGKIDQKVLPADELVTLENGRFDRLGAINKRRGYSLLDEACSDLVDYKGSLVSRNIERSDRAGTGIITPATVLAYGSQKFVGSKGYSDGIDYTMMPVSKGSEYRQEDSQVAISSDGKWACITFTDVVWDQTNDRKSYNKRVSIVDRETNTLVESDIKVGAAKYSGNQGRRMRPIWLDSKFYIFGEDELALKFWILDPTEATIQLKNLTGNSAQAGTVILAAGTYPLASSGTFVTTVASFDVVASSDTRYAFLYTKWYSSSHYNNLYLFDTDDNSIDLKANQANASLQGHLAIHRSTATGTNANKISCAHQNGTNLITVNMVESFTGSVVGFTAGTSFGLGTDNIWRGFFRDSINPRYTSDQDVQLVWEAGKGAVTGEAGQYLIRLIDGYHDSLVQTVLSNRVISAKARLAFGLGRGPITIGTYHDDNPTANTAVSTAPVNTISLWDTDTNDNAQRYSTGVSNNANNASYMFSGSANAASFTTSGSNEKLTVDFEPPIVYSSHVKFWQLAGTSLTFAINGGGFSSTASTSTALITAHTGSGALSKLEFYKSGGTMSVISILVDGSPLFDEILGPWERDTLPVATFNPEWISDCLQTASVTGAAAHLNGEAVAVPVGHAFERFGLVGDIVLNSTVQLFDFRRYNEERVDVPAPSSAMLHDVLYVADKGLFQYDGKKFYSVGFSDRPAFGITLVTSAGNLGNGVYYYKVVYEWVDAQGNLHQSEPSDGITVTTDGSNEKVTIDIADLDIGGDGGLAARQDTKMAVYRTQVGGSIFNNIMSIALGNERQAAGDAATGIITVVDNISDAVAATGKFLYTDGGEVENKTPPFSARYVVAHRDRLFVIGKNDVVYFSKLAKDGYGIGFNENFFVKTPDNISDPPTALGSMDGNLIIFTENSIFMVGGEGPDNTGAGGFYEAKKVPSNVGAVKGSPVRLINDGLIFVSKNDTGDYKGNKIYLLGRNMTVTYFGAAVEETLGIGPSDVPYVIRDIIVDSKQDTVFFLLSLMSGTPDGVKMITYNYELKQWGVDKLADTYGSGAGGSFALSAVKDDKKLYVGLRHDADDQDPRAYLETNGYTDNAVYVPLKVKTGWINMTGIQSYQRAYAFHVLGETKDAVTLTVNVYYDYDDSTLPATNTYTFSNTTTGTNKMQFRGLLSKQKCQAIQFEIVDADNGGSTDSGYTVTEIALELGIKSDGYRDSNAKLSSTSTVGSNT